MSNQFYKPVAGIPRITKATRAGLYRVLFCPIEQVISIPSANPVTCTVDVPIVIQGSWYEVESANFQNSYDEELQAADAGDFYTIELSIFTPFYGTDKHLTLDRLKSHRYLILVVNPAKEVRILGNKEAPARLGSRHSSGQRSSSAPGDTLRFTWVNVDKPLLYTCLLP